jgi:(E)-4-hydroxy-3-methylbut-2-enyl-diphosphate synthase
MTAGTEIGALLVDGLGDGVLIECNTQDLNALRNLSFNLLQGSRMRNTKTGDNRTLICVMFCFLEIS